MKVRVTTGPKAGSILHVPYDQNSQGMLNSGLWETVPETPKAVEPPHWFLFTGLHTGLVSLGFKCEACRETSYFNPDVNLGAKKIVEASRPHCTHRTPCPIEIADSYVASGGGTPLPTFELVNGPADPARA